MTASTCVLSATDGSATISGTAMKCCSIRWLPPNKEWTGRDPSSVHSRESLSRAWVLSKGPKCFRPIPDERNAAIAAAVSGNVEGLRVLVREAQQRGEGAMAKLLDEPDDTGNSALIWAVDRNQSEVLELLLGPDVLLSGYEAKDPPLDLARRGYMGNTALSRAARRNNVRAMTMLLDAADELAKLQGGPSIPLDEVCNEKLQYPMHFAAFKVKLETLEFLLARGCDSYVVDRKGRTPLEDTASPEVKARIREARQAKRELKEQQ